MEIGVKIQGGKYISFDDVPQINPFQQKDSPANRAFLTRWLKTLSRLDDNHTMETINKVIDANYSLDKQDRTLANLYLKFGLKGEGGFYDNMARWLPDGIYETYFNGEVDNLSFENPIVAFDMTRVNKNPEVLAPIAEYLYHRIETLAEEDPSPFILWTDEYKNYLNNPVLGAKQALAKEQYRKLGGVCVDAVQDPSHVTGTMKEPNKLGIDTLEQYATFIFFPSASADFELLKQYFGINKTEYDWIRNMANFRKILIKRKTGTSTILNIDLSVIGSLLKAYSSDADKVVQVRELIRDNPRDWEEIWINQ